MFPYSYVHSRDASTFSQETTSECFVNKALLLSDAHSPKEIANTIGVTDHAVRSQIKNIFTFLGLSERAARAKFQPILDAVNAATFLR